MNKRGFISSAAMSLVFIGVIASMFSFLFVMNDVHSASQVGMTVEMTKWHGDLADYYCKENMECNQDIFKTVVIGQDVGPEISRYGNETTLSFTDNELMNIEVILVENYAPTVVLTENDEDPLDGNVTFNVRACNPEGSLAEDDENFSLYWNDTDTWVFLEDDNLTEDDLGEYSGECEMNVTEELVSGDYKFKANVSDRDKSGEDIIVRTVQ